MIEEYVCLVEINVEGEEISSWPKQHYIIVGSEGRH